MKKKTLIITDGIDNQLGKVSIEETKKGWKTT